MRRRPTNRNRGRPGRRLAAHDSRRPAISREDQFRATTDRDIRDKCDLTGRTSGNSGADIVSPRASSQ